MKKWILKSEIAKVLSTYSIRQDEFEPVANLDYCYMSRYVKGYMITIMEEVSGTEKTGRIIVSHTQDNGKKSYQDIWERDFNNRLHFCFRNLSKQPFADVDYIKDLESQNDKLKKVGAMLQKELEDLKQKYQKLNVETIQNQQISELQSELAKLKQHNARGAGRKPSQERLNTIDRVKALIESGCSDQDIISQLGISRATFYRYKKNINN